MTVDIKQFLSEIQHIAAAPGGVQQIRELVLQLAISGDLTTRISGDTCASDLIAANWEKQAQLIAHGDLEYQHALPKITERDQPWRLPDGWVWCRLGEVTSYGYAAKAEPEDVNDQTWVLELEDIEKGTSRLIKRVFARDRKFRSTKNRFSEGAVLYGKLRPYLNKVLVADEDGVCTTEIAPIYFYGSIEPQYLRWYLTSPFFTAYAAASTHGINLPRLGTEAARNAPFPFPPAREQKYIVAKVNELMALCDKLEAQQQEREASRRLTRTAVLGSLTRARSSDGLSSAWRRVERSISLLLGQSTDVADLRAAILDLAATGRLSEWQTEDTPVVVFLEEAKASRDRRIADRDVEPRHLTPTGLKDVDIPTPAHWGKSRIDDLFQFIDYRGQTPTKTTSGRVLITAKNVRPGRIESHPVEYISEIGYDEWMTRGFPEVGDLLITTEAPLGNVARIEDAPRFALAQRVIDLQPYAAIQTKFFMFFMMSPSFQRLLWANATGTTAKGIKAAKLKQLRLAIPPREEQERIVKCVEALLASCDRLETQLTKATSVAEHLAKACTAAITGIQIEDKKRMKTPKTELVSTLRVGVKPTSRDQALLAAILIRNNDELPAKMLWNASGLEIDPFYQQLKTEMAQGWIVQPEVAYMKEVEAS